MEQSDIKKEDDFVGNYLMAGLVSYDHNPTGYPLQEVMKWLLEGNSFPVKGFPTLSVKGRKHRAPANFPGFPPYIWYGIYVEGPNADKQRALKEALRILKEKG